VHACLRPGRFWPLTALRHRPGSSGYRTGTAPCQMIKTGLGRRRGNGSAFPWGAFLHGRHSASGITDCVSV